MVMAVWILFCLFASVGLVQCGIWLFGAIKAPDRLPCGYHVLPLYDDAEKIEVTIRSGLERIRRSDICGEPLLLVDMGLGEECRDICDKLVQELCGVYVCGKADLAQTVEYLDNLQNSPDDVE